VKIFVEYTIILSSSILETDSIINELC